VIAVLGGFEVGMVFAIRPSLNDRAIQFFGIFSSVLLSLGLVTQYYEIYQRREVVGLSIAFMTVDFLGGSPFTFVPSRHEVIDSFGQEFSQTYPWHLNQNSIP
jgi:uncharacterized protein with PQ loop repeat